MLRRWVLAQSCCKLVYFGVELEASFAAKLAVFVRFKAIVAVEEEVSENFEKFVAAVLESIELEAKALAAFENLVVESMFKESSGKFTLSAS